MTILTDERPTPVVAAVEVCETAITLVLNDGRKIVAPLSWYPRLVHATEQERNNFRLMGGGRGIHWPEVEEDISLESVLAGRRSMESPASLKRWLAAREKSKVDR